jgi:M6 family metalloprotease-like protein
VEVGRSHLEFFVAQVLTIASRTPWWLGAISAALLAGITGPGGLAAQRPAQRPVLPRHEPKGLDFRPNGAWRRRAALVRETRAALLRSGQLAALNAGRRALASAAVVSGTFKIPAVLILPANVSAPFPPANYQQTLFGTVPPNGKPYTVSTFYQQLSNGAVRLGGTVLGWYQAPQPNTYYEDGCNGIGIFNICPHGGQRLGELFLTALTAADAAGTDWGQFDNDGPDGVPNSGDDDGYVDFVAFIHPDVDGACQGPTRNPHIWSHRFVISGVSATGLPYTTKTAAHNGGMIRVEDYIVGSGVGGSNACTAGRIMPIGTFSHETGHAFGLPDLYDTDGTSAGIGYWGLMGAGNYSSPDSPSRMEAWSLSQLGWIDVQPLPAGQTSIPPITQSHTAYIIPIATSSRDEYYLLENRQRLESDTALLNSIFTMGPGLLVWHIDNAQIDARGLNADNRVNTGPIHGVELVQADGLGQLDVVRGGNLGDAGDPFPGSASRNRFSAQTTPRAFDNQGGFVGYMLDQFQSVTGAGAPSIRVRQTSRPLSLIKTNRSDVPLAVAGITSNRFADILIPGEPVQVAAPQNVPLNPSERVAFRRWSNGQPATFTLTPSAGAPDTVEATYETEFLLLVRFAGTGTVESSLPGVLHTGAYRPDTTTVTLRAVPSKGASFVGWSGDTTATEPLLLVPGGRPFSVTATFSVSAEILAVVDAAKALMGGPLLAGEVSAGLDAAGNHNGQYDLGDFLAYLDRNHATLTPALVQQLLAQVAPVTPAARRNGRTGR